MRTWGRITQPDGTKQWVLVPEVNGDFTYGWITTLIQCLKLNLNESPFYANYGIPAQRAIIQQLFPDFYVNQTQQQFAQYFASLTITRVPSADPTKLTYSVEIVTLQGSVIMQEVAV